MFFSAVIQAPQLLSLLLVARCGRTTFALSLGSPVQSISPGDGSAVAFDYAASPAPPSSGSHGGHFLLFAPGKKFIAGNDLWPGYPQGLRQHLARSQVTRPELKMAHFLCHSRPALGTLRDQEVQPRSEPKKKNENFAPTTSSRDDLGSVLPPHADTDVTRNLCHGLRHFFDAENRHHRNNDIPGFLELSCRQRMQRCLLSGCLTVSVAQKATPARLSLLPHTPLTPTPSPPHPHPHDAYLCCTAPHVFRTTGITRWRHGGCAEELCPPYPLIPHLPHHPPPTPSSPTLLGHRRRESAEGAGWGIQGVSRGGCSHLHQLSSPTPSIPQCLLS
ncbi:hypothetical protein C0Q70_08694 [Pomacea canaliculata]|uniref:Uncharacterized protein n=1 Tax=Pomacea canaliculata TaxID=400727 RepID=A0A2T7P7R7_POMCA|nr:hypothetical protein C0Q70_08694 [Pomacea canaliculata]